jgi:hypothetical protein
MDEEKSGGAADSDVSKHQDGPSVILATEEISEKIRRKPPRLSNNRLLFLIVLLLNVAIGASSAYYWRNPRLAAIEDRADAKSQIVSSDLGDIKQEDLAAKSDAPTTLHYKSDPMTLEFDYPVDWRISASPDNKQVTITSSRFTLESPSGPTEAAINVFIGARDTSDKSQYFELLAPENLVTRTSEKVIYSNPTKGQRKETNLTFVHGVGENEAVFHSLIVSGNQTYAPGETLASKDLSKVDPLITAHAQTCFKNCQAYILGDINEVQWQNNEQFKKLRTMLASMRFDI